MHNFLLNRDRIGAEVAMLAHWFKKYSIDLLPPHCEVCQMEIGGQSHLSWLCEHCQRYLAETSRCMRCGLPTEGLVEVCGRCLVEPPIWQHVYCVGNYQAPLSSYVHRLKFERQFWQAPKLASLLAPRIDQPAELITSVPLHWRRHCQRGFNQSELLAMSLAKNLNLPYQTLFKRTRATSPQQGKNKRQRERNLRHAFQLVHPVNVSHVAIVDDVLTTGSTVQHLCNLLLEAGVKTVDIYCICRTPEPSEKD